MSCNRVQQVTTAGYDSLGRTVSTTLPLEGTGLTMSAMAYSYAACTRSPSKPCLEVDMTQRLDSSTTVTAADFYDGWGRHVESRKPTPNGTDVVQYAAYDPMGRVNFLSQPYYVSGSQPAEFVTPDDSKPGTSTSYDGLGRTLATTDPLLATTTMAYAPTCSISGTSDTNCYAAITTTDALHHQKASYADALGHERYTQDWTGTGTYTLYRTVKKLYDYNGNVVTTTYADGTHQATATYDMLSRLTASTDPDLGSYTYTYDANGNQVSVVDPRGASGTVYVCYDGLNRVTQKSTTSNCSSPFATSTYDSGINGIGHLTGETFASNGVSGSYAYAFDGRGRQTGWTMTVGSTPYAFAMGYNDANQQTSTTYPDGDVLSTNYGSQGWFGGASSSTSGTLVNTVQYQGLAGASQKVSNAAVGSTGQYAWALTYDTNLRLADTNVKAGSSPLFDQQRGFDAVGNVVTTTTTVPAGTDNQAFCYDDLNRLTWGGTAGGTIPACAGTIASGTLTAAQYRQSYGYDTLDRLTQGPAGAGYGYGDSNHLDAVTSAPNYSAAFDAAGSQTAALFRGNGMART